MITVVLRSGGTGWRTGWCQEETQGVVTDGSELSYCSFREVQHVCLHPDSSERAAPPSC